MVEKEKKRSCWRREIPIHHLYPLSFGSSPCLSAETSSKQLLHSWIPLQKSVTQFTSARYFPCSWSVQARPNLPFVFLSFFLSCTDNSFKIQSWNERDIAFCKRVKPFNHFHFLRQEAKDYWLQNPLLVCIVTYIYSFFSWAYLSHTCSSNYTYIYIHILYRQPTSQIWKLYEKEKKVSSMRWALKRIN